MTLREGTSVNYTEDQEAHEGEERVQDARHAYLISMAVQEEAEGGHSSIASGCSKWRWWLGITGGNI